MNPTSQPSRSYAGIVAVLAVIPVSGAFATAPITGHVRDTTGRGLGGITIFAEGPSADLPETVTDADGAFELALPEGRFEVVAVTPDGRSASVPVVVPAAEPIVLVIAAPAGSAVDEDFVTDVRAPSPHAGTASTRRVDGQTLELIGGKSAEDALRLVPGMVLVQHGNEGKGHQFFLRGFDAIHGADLEIRVEGFRLNEHSNIHAQGYLDLGLVIPELIHEVEVVKGPFTLAQGPFAMAGSATYRLGVGPDALGTRLAYTGGTTNRHRLLATWSPKDGDGHQFVAVEGTWDAGFGDNRRTRRLTAMGRVAPLTSGNHELSLLAMGYYADFGLPTPLRVDDIEAGLIDFHGTYTDDTRGRSARGVLGLDYRWESGDHRVVGQLYGSFRHLRLLENFTGQLGDEIAGDRRGQAEDTGSIATGLLWDGRVHDTVTLLAGFEHRSDRLDQQQDHVAADHSVVGTDRDLTAWQHSLGLQFGAQWTPLDALRWDVGARLDASHYALPETDGATRVVIAPRTILQWFAHPEVTVSAAYGRGHRPPEARAFSTFEAPTSGFSEEIYRGGEPQVTMSDAVELGLTWTPTPWIVVGVSGFLTLIERESVFDHVSGLSLELNGTRRAGAELSLRARPLPWLQLDGHLTWSHARFIESGRVVPLVPEWVGGFTGTFRHPLGFEGGIRLLGVSARPLPHGATGEPLVQLDLGFGYRWRWLRVYVEIENLLGTEQREGEFHYASDFGTRPRSFLPVTHVTAGSPINARFTLQATF